MPKYAPSFVRPQLQYSALLSHGLLTLGIVSTLGLSGCSGKEDPKSASKDQSSATSEDSKASTGKSKKSKKPKGSDSENNDEDAGESNDEKKIPKFDMGAHPDNKKPEGDACECEPGADLIFLLGNKGSIWSFDPSAKPDDAFKQLANPGCDIPIGQHPFSMGVDRQANGWMTVRSPGTLYKFNTAKDNSCKKTNHVPGTEGFTLYGMAFVEHPNDGRCEQLYLHSFDGEVPSEGNGAGTLGVMDPETLKIKKVGPIDFNGGELTGTADGRLFAFAGQPGRLLEYDPKTAKVKKEVNLGKLDLSSSFAFAFWGGDFYFFTDKLGTIPIKSQVTKLDYTGDGSVSTFTVAPLRVAGAGVSICAPLEEPPPK